MPLKRWQSLDFFSLPREDVAHLQVASTWKGQLIELHEQVQLQAWCDLEYFYFLVDAPFSDDPPPPKPPVERGLSTSDLWNYEVVELFVAGAPNASGQQPYLEIECSP
ncbi:MAG: hypothetical protein AAGJ35_05980, partial [Myxococcota bacterium]